MIKTEFYGRKAIVINKGHPQCGHIGTCLGANKTLLGWQMKFRRDDTGQEFYVKDGKDVRWIK
jgi:hypothetical protein